VAARRNVRAGRVSSDSIREVLTMTIRDVLEQQAVKNPDKVYMYFEDITKTYAEINEIANRVANAMLSLGVKRGDNVCLLLTNRAEFIYMMYGLAKIGAVTCPINPALRPDEVEYIVNNCEGRSCRWCVKSASAFPRSWM
jgi:acyl-CoA synthetase (AMP-forming)/AMP-acid ligase II